MDQSDSCGPQVDRQVVYFVKSKAGYLFLWDVFPARVVPRQTEEKKHTRWGPTALSTVFSMQQRSFIAISCWCNGVLSTRLIEALWSTWSKLTRVPWWFEGFSWLVERSWFFQNRKAPRSILQVTCGSATTDSCSFDSLGSSLWGDCVSVYLNPPKPRAIHISTNRPWSMLKLDKKK